MLALFLYFGPLMKNKVHYSFLMGLTIICLLLALSSVDEFSVGPLEFRRIDLLSDVSLQYDTPDVVVDSVALALKNITPDSIQVMQDSLVSEVEQECPTGLTCIEDYSADKSALNDFINALARVKKDGSVLRIAFYGDSFIEGDVFCGSFRDTLQTIFGGRGVGYVPITSTVTGFRNTIKHKFENWQTSSLVNITSDADIGPAGYTFLPLENNMVEYRPSRQRYLREFNVVKLYYTSLDSAILRASLDTVALTEILVPSERLREWQYRRSGMKRARFEFHSADSVMVYGASFESSQGIYVDNFSVRGNSGLNLNRVPLPLYRQFDQYRNYKLVILQFGLNLVVEDKLNYEAYVERMVGVVNNLKKAFPNASFLLLSVSDRSTNMNGEYQTMPAIPVMRDAQRLIAQECGIAFWDMFTAMGGENSMVKFVNARPALGARDFTHLTFRGGRKLAVSLVRSLLVELSKYEDKTVQAP